VRDDELVGENGVLAEHLLDHDFQALARERLAVHDDVAVPGLRSAEQLARGGHRRFRRA
jgi:hypothetical protein